MKDPTKWNDRPRRWYDPDPFLYYIAIAIVVAGVIWRATHGQNYR